MTELTLWLLLFLVGVWLPLSAIIGLISANCAITCFFEPVELWYVFACLMEVLSLVYEGGWLVSCCPYNGYLLLSAQPAAAGSKGLNC